MSEFHIHLNAKDIKSDFPSFLLELGFQIMNFLPVNVELPPSIKTIKFIE